MSLNNADIVDKSSITARGYRHRTTVPSKIYKKLNLKDKDQLRWILFKDGRLMIEKVEEK